MLFSVVANSVMYFIAFMSSVEICTTISGPSELYVTVFSDANRWENATNDPGVCSGCKEIPLMLREEAFTVSENDKISW